MELKAQFHNIINFNYSKEDNSVLGVYDLSMYDCILYVLKIQQKETILNDILSSNFFSVIANIHFYYRRFLDP